VPIRHGRFFPLALANSPGGDGGRNLERATPQPGATNDEEVGGALCGVPAEHERRPGPVRRCAGGRGHVRAAAADPESADGRDQLQAPAGVGSLGEAVLL